MATRDRKAYSTNRHATRYAELVCLLGGRCHQCGTADNIVVDHIDETQRHPKLNALHDLCATTLDKFHEQAYQYHIVCLACRAAWFTARSNRPRVCCLCKLEKPVTEFNKKSKSRQPYCKKCQSVKYKQYYATEPKELIRLKTSNMAVKARIRSFIQELKTAPCKDCGGTFHHHSMDFDHLPGSIKKFSIAIASAGAFSMDRVRDEMVKCDLVCANCHRVRTYNRRHKLCV